MAFQYKIFNVLLVYFYLPKVQMTDFFSIKFVKIRQNSVQKKKLKSAVCKGRRLLNHFYNQIVMPLIDLLYIFLSEYQYPNRCERYNQKNIVDHLKPNLINGFFIKFFIF